MQKISGTFNGTGSAMYVGIGFIPDKLVLQSLDASTDLYTITWARNFRGPNTSSGNISEGVLSTNGTTSELGKGAGVRPYYGGDIITAAQATAGLHLVPVTSKDMRNISGNGGNITTWTLGSSSNFTGNWDNTCDTTYIGVGSRIVIKENVTGVIKESHITALTSNGEAANEVTLADSINSGEILFLGRMYDYVAGTAGMVMPQGFVINETSAFNQSGEVVYFEAELFNG